MVIDPSLEWIIQAADFASAGRNCPFDGWNVKGRAVAAIVGGELKAFSRFATGDGVAAGSLRDSANE
jgi:dihydroorotase-like cyclic amidohydrolase